MRKHLLALVAMLSLLSPAKAADSTLALLTAAGAVSGADLLYCTQAGADRKCTATQMATYINSLFSGDMTVTSGGAATLKNTGPGATGPLGSATVAPIITIDAQGRVTALSSATVTPALGSITGFGTSVAAALAATLNSSTGPIGALTPTNNNCVVGNGTAWTSAACASTSSTAVPSVQTGTNYAFQGTDLTKIIYLSNAANQVPTIAQAGTGSFTNGWYTTACNIGAGTQTITPTTSTIGGASTYVLPAGSAAAPKCIGLVSDGTNYVIVPDYFRFGANVETAAGLALSAAGGLTTTVANGTSALGTSAISSQTCATVVTTAASGVATTDVVQWGFNGDPTGSTGYLPTAMLTIVAYPSSGNVNFKVCNLTGSSITPASQTLNWRVTR